MSSNTESIIEAGNEEIPSSSPNMAPRTIKNHHLPLALIILISMMIIIIESKMQSPPDDLPPLLQILASRQLIHPNKFLTNTSTELEERNSASSNNECTMEKMIEMDRLFELIQTFGPRGREFPTNLEEMDFYCRETTKMMNQLERFITHCYHQRIEQAARVFLINLRRTLRGVCHLKRKTQKLQSLFQITPCLNSRRKEDRCLEEMVNQTRKLIPVAAEDALKLHRACCNYAEYQRCEERFLDSLDCMKPDGKETLLDLIHSITDESSSLVCSEYIILDDDRGQSERCQQTNLLPLEKLPLNPLVEPLDNRLHSMFSTIITLTETLVMFGGIGGPNNIKPGR